MAHVCTIKPPTEERDEEGCLLRRLCKRLQRSTLVSGDNPLSLYYFRSLVSIKREQERQLNTTRFMIHPYSNFRMWFDVYLIFLYGTTLVTKPLQYGFTRQRHYQSINFYSLYSSITHALFLFHIPLNFFCGFDRKYSNTVELRPRVTAKQYMSSPYFACDILSSIPKVLLYNIPRFPGFYYVMALVNILALLRIIRLVSLLFCVERISRYMRNNSRGTLLLIYTFIIILNVVHWMACLQYGVPRLTRKYIVHSNESETWFTRYGLSEKSLYIQYFSAFFKSSAYILGVRVTKIYEEILPEEYITAVITYFIGKIVVGFVWIILAVAILNSRSVDIKFLELINQLDEYMKRKQLPLSLKERISHYYHFKYQSKYINEEQVNSMLSNNLKIDVNMHLCKSLIENVSLFANLNPTELQNLVQYLRPEIFLPNDTIIRHGTYGDAMYFLSSGTVAVYTCSGKEICHLQDGAYFGEISLLFKGQTRTATVVAIETTQVYRLDRKKFEISLLKNKQVLDKMLNEVSRRLDETTRIDEEYKKMLFEQTFQSKKVP